MQLVLRLIKVQQLQAYDNFAECGYPISAYWFSYSHILLNYLSFNSVILSAPDVFVKS